MTEDSRGDEGGKEGDEFVEKDDEEEVSIRSPPPPPPPPPFDDAMMIKRGFAGSDGTGLRGLVGGKGFLPFGTPS